MRTVIPGCGMQNSETSHARTGGPAAGSAGRRTALLRTIVCVHLACCVAGVGAAAAQQLLDRILARVGGNAITLTDVQAARALAIVPGPGEREALQQMIDRQLLLIEVARFPPPEPADAAVAAEVARERAAAGARLDAIMQSTGIDEARLRDLARDTLRIDAYVDQRFGTALQVTDDEAAGYYGAHPDEFRRNGAVIPFEEALPQARERANAERRRSQVERWLLDLRARADIVVSADRS